MASKSKKSRKEKQDIFQRSSFRISDPPNDTGDSEFLIPKNTEDSEFLIPKQHKRFRISDPPNNTGDSEFLIPQIRKEIQNFWSPNNTGDSEFLIPRPNNTALSRGEDSEFLIPQTTREIKNFQSPKQYREVFNISDNPNNLRETSYFSLWSQSSEMSQNLRFKSTHDSGAVQGLIVPRYKLYSIASVTSNTATLNFIIEGFSSQMGAIPLKLTIQQFIFTGFKFNTCNEHIMIMYVFDSHFRVS